MDWSSISENIYEINNIKMNVASVGSESDPAIVFLHGFPEVWQSWANQILYLNPKGYRCIAPDLRGYRKTEIEVPGDPESYSVENIIKDILALMKILNIDKIFLVGHDWGAFMAWSFCLLHPDKVRAVVNLSVPYIAMNPDKSFLDGFRDYYGDLYYMCRFQEIGEMEKEFASMETEQVLKILYSSFGLNPLMIPEEKNGGFKSLPIPKILPSWLTKEVLDCYTQLFNHTGFTGGLSYYRAMDISWKYLLTSKDDKVIVPAKPPSPNFSGRGTWNPYAVNPRGNFSPNYSAPPPGFSRGNTPQQGSTPNPNAANRPVCQLCSKVGHIASRCYQRFNFEFPGLVALFNNRIIIQLFLVVFSLFCFSHKQDHRLHFEGMKDYIFINGGFKKDVPSLEEVVIIQDVPHFANQAKPDEISGQIHEFFKNAALVVDGQRTGGAGEKRPEKGRTVFENGEGGKVEWGKLEVFLKNSNRVLTSLIAVVNLSVPYIAMNPNKKFMQGFRDYYGDLYYMCRFQAIGEMEDEFASMDTADVLKILYSSFGLDPLMIPLEKDGGFKSLPIPKTLPSWLTDEVLGCYTKLFRKSGFTGGLSYYRALDIIESVEACCGASEKSQQKTDWDTHQYVY
ncbi:hypothetical protein G4B88_011201 [Cannabis sativa]|uniref:AB hydrolase-1 domain-containing protein n=1 Tax=Cannabis sativa TaxID=3483 RepID=A0A7J6DKQ6_CANSA|nr:hypothetical protein G4B88_011201 [Cannabis sativa]